MIPEPLHPAVVHFPIVLSFLLPISALAALWTIRRGAPATKAWAVPVLVAVALTASGWVALETGEEEGEVVESVVGEQAVHEHEEAAERFMLFAGIATVVLAAGLLRGTVGTAARVVGTVGTVVVLVGAYQVGEAGGELVYVHGAAQAYLEGGARAAEGAAARAHEEHEEDERHEH